MIERVSGRLEREVAPELDFPELEQYNEYLKASRVYVNRAGSVPQEQIERFEGVLAAPDEDAESAEEVSPFPLLGTGLQGDALVGGDRVAHTLGLLRSVVGL